MICVSCLKWRSEVGLQWEGRSFASGRQEVVVSSILVWFHSVGDAILLSHESAYHFDLKHHMQVVWMSCPRCYWLSSSWELAMAPAYVARDVNSYQDQN